jgi:hypothetical protein
LTQLQAPAFEIASIEETGTARVERELIVGQAEHATADIGGDDIVYRIAITEGGESQEFLFFRPERLARPSDERIREMINQMGREFEPGRSALEQFGMRVQPHPAGLAIHLPY